MKFDYWLNVEAMEPEQLRGRIGKILVRRRTTGTIAIFDSEEKIGGESYPGTLFGRAELMFILGEFNGLSRISKRHLEIYVNEVDLNQFIVEDYDSTNGTIFQGGIDRGTSIVVDLAGEITLKLSKFEGEINLQSFGVDRSMISYTENEISELPPQILKSDDEIMNYITSEVKRCSDELDMKWFIRRKWSVREKPVYESNISDYEWKLIPKSEDNWSSWMKINRSPDFSPTNIDSGDFEGAYYVISTDSKTITFEHSGDYTGRVRTEADPYEGVHCVILHAWSFPVSHGKLAEWLKSLVSKYPPNWFSLT